MDIEVVLADLSTKIPCLQWIFRPEYAPYVNTAGTILLGWMVVCFLVNLMWTFLVPLVVSILGVIIICPATGIWILGQMSPGTENILAEVSRKIQALLP